MRISNRSTTIYNGITVSTELVGNIRRQKIYQMCYCSLQPTLPGGGVFNQLDLGGGGGGGVFNQLDLGGGRGGGGSSTNLTLGGGGGGVFNQLDLGGGLGGTHHALLLDVISLLTCGQKDELPACTGLYRYVAVHHGKYPPPLNRRTETLKTLPSRYFVCGR